MANSGGFHGKDHERFPAPESLSEAKVASTPSMSFAREEFGEKSTNELEKLLVGTCVTEGHATAFAEVLPHVTCLLAGGLSLLGSQISEMDGEAKARTFTTNSRATVKAFTGFVVVGSGPDITTQTLQAFRGRVLAGLEIPVLASTDDKVALRFLAEVSVMTNVEVAEALRGRQGQHFVQTLSTSPTFSIVVTYAAFWDDLWDWLKGLAKWVADAAKEFGEAAAKVANAVVNGVFCKFEHATEIVEQIPFVGLLIAGIYYTAGRTDEGTAALAYNLNAIVTLIGGAVGAYLGGPGGAMIGAGLGKAVGLLIQKALSNLIKDDKIKAEVGDISATKFFIDVALAGAAGTGAGAVGKALAEDIGLGAVKAFAISKGLATLLASIPAYFASKAMDSDSGKATDSDSGKATGTSDSGEATGASDSGKATGTSDSSNATGASDVSTATADMHEEQERQHREPHHHTGSRDY